MPSPSPEPDQASTSRHAFQFRDYRLYQGARMLAVTSLEMQSVAVAWQVYEITRRPIDLGYVGLAQFLPGVLLFLIGGHAADRFDRRRILLICFSVYAVCSTLLLLITAELPRSVLAIYGVLVLLGSTRAFSGSASQSLLPQLVPDDVFPNAVAWGSSIFMVATILGPAVGGLVYGWTSGPLAVYLFASVTFAASVLLIWRMHVRTGRMEKRNTSLDTLLAGFRYVWRKKVVLGSISLDLFGVLLGGAVALLPVYAREILHVGPWGLGIMRSAPAVGAALMGATLALRPLRRRAGKIMLVCVAIFGVATIAFGLSRSVALSLIALFIVGASDMVSVVIRSTLVQVATPPEMRGRVSAVNMLFVGASNELGQFESGITAQWLGTVPAVVLGGVGSLVIVALWAWRFPELRQVEQLTSIAPDEYVTVPSEQTMSTD
jgi:MFS family permease